MTDPFAVPAYPPVECPRCGHKYSPGGQWRHCAIGLIECPGGQLHEHVRSQGPYDERYEVTSDNRMRVVWTSPNTTRSATEATHGEW